MKPVLACLLALALVAILAPTSPPTLTDYAWTGLGEGDDWDNEDNWFGGGAGFPDGSNDRALIPDKEGKPWEINQKEYIIDKLTIEENVDFAGTVTLTTETLVIDATEFQKYLEVELTGSGGIQAND